LFPLRDNIPTEHFPLVTVALIVANVLMYFLFQHGGLSLGSPQSSEYLCNLYEYGVIPREITNGDFDLQAQGCQTFEASPWLTLFTSMFMHGGLLHLGGNMLFLWIFGNNVEDSMGPVKFLLFYVLGGLAADAAQILVDTSSTIPTIGASGAVAGVLGGYLLLFPRARVVTVVFIIFFFTILELPALLFLIVWIGQQFLFAYFDLVGPQEGGGVAYFAHIGGFLFGLALIRAFASEKRRKRQLERAGMR
jgi:membrane associated rhomboid family serine protease